MKRTEVLSNVRQTLFRRRDALRQSLSIHRSLLGADARTTGDSIDAAIESEHSEMESQLASAESRELAAIDDAINRIEAGLFGVCEDCGKPIPVARLQALPYATLCIECQREEERFGTVMRSGIPATSHQFAEVDLEAY